MTLQELTKRVNEVARAGLLSAEGGLILADCVAEDRTRIESLESEVTELRATNKFLGGAVHLLLAREFGPEYREQSGLFG